MPTRRLIKWLIPGLALLALIGVVAIRAIGSVTPFADNTFGDQHLKTTIALLELHKVRTGRYPATLKDIEFTGEWDQIALGSVRYCPNAAATEYYVEATRGWVGRPQLSYPPAFWNGTGYRATLVSACP